MSGKDRTCPHREATEASARAALAGRSSNANIEHLETCDQCRAAFRRLTNSPEGVQGGFPEVADYTIVERIGEGGFGAVYCAIHHEKQRSEALKLLQGVCPERVAYFENEVHLIGRLRHPNIAMLYESHLSRPPLYYSMELIQGRPLNAYLAERAVSTADRIRIVLAVTRAVAYAHAQGVVHRDIKPQNILIDGQGEPRIIDFGIAVRLGLQGKGTNAELRRIMNADPERAEALAREETDAGDGDASSRTGVVGTLGYMSPEQRAGRRVDGRTDVYSLGALLYFCTTGEPPRKLKRGAGLEPTLRELRISRADELAAIIARCLAPSPEQRYPSCAALADDLERYLLARRTAADSNRSLLHRARRVATYVALNHPRPLAVAIVAATTLILSLLLWTAGSRTFVQGPEAGSVVLVGFDAATEDALRAGQIGGDIPGLSADNRKSLRLLHARLLERLAVAQPSVVVLDYYFPDCRPEYDAAFVAAAQAAGAPVVVGVRRFDVDGRPEICPAIRDAVDGWGALLAVDPAGSSNETNLPLAIRRGYEAPFPSLALAGYAQRRFAGSAPAIEADEAGNRLLVRYRKRNAPPGASHWWRATDAIPIANVTVPRRDAQAAGGGTIRAGDRLYHASYRTPGEPRLERLVSYRDLLLADAAALREMLQGRAVVVGQMLGRQDLHATGAGERVYGCQLQAQVLHALLNGEHFVRLSRPAVLFRVLGWSLLALIVVSLGPPPRTVLSPAVAAAIVAALAAAGVLTAWLTATQLSARGWVEAGIAAAALLTALPLLVAARQARQRQLELAPGAALQSAARRASSTLPLVAEAGAGEDDAGSQRALRVAERPVEAILGEARCASRAISGSRPPAPRARQR